MESDSAKLEVGPNPLVAGKEGPCSAVDSGFETAVEFDKKAVTWIRRKNDLCLVPSVALIYLFCFIDRTNIGNARLAGLEEDLDLTGYDYNIALSIFYIPYILLEIPSNMACKYFGPERFLPFLTLCFGICSIAMGFVTDFNSICGVRFLLGCFEGGILPGIAYYLSRWYTRTELGLRLALYVVMAPLAGAFGGLLASGILRLDDFGAVQAWQKIFVIEGIITCAIGLATFFTLSNSPATARWLSPAEKAIATARLNQDHASEQGTNDRMSLNKLLRGVWNPVTLVSSIALLIINITVQGVAFFTPTIVQTIYPDASVVTQQLYTVPPYAVGAFFTILLPYLMGRFDRRIIFYIISMPFLIIGFAIFLGTSNASARYAALFLTASFSMPFVVFTTATVSANTVSDTTRSVGIGTALMLANCGGLVATWSYVPSDVPEFVIASSLNVAVAVAVLLISSGLLLWMMADNRKRDKRMQVAGGGDSSSMEGASMEELEWRHPHFRWKL
ncbi:major facilitator superfamily domain-containing protein [Aspergillus egyptiacus]|nr:major facilitator superfamily domain-containing protein [Aspergillus egyptiacus]